MDHDSLTHAPKIIRSRLSSPTLSFRNSGSPWLKASPGDYPTGPMPWLSQDWSVPFSPKAALCCAMDSSTGRAPITSSNHPLNLVFTSTELPNERWRRWASQRASSSLSTERASAQLMTSNQSMKLTAPRQYTSWGGEAAEQNVPEKIEGEPEHDRCEPAVAQKKPALEHVGEVKRLNR